MTFRVASNTDKRPMPTELLVDNSPGVMIPKFARRDDPEVPGVTIPKDLRHRWRRILRVNGRPPLIQASAHAIMDQ
jgi:hypothetical protein